MSPDEPDPLASLLAVLDLEELGSAQVDVKPVARATSSGGAALEMPEVFAEDTTLFVGQSQKMPHNRVFGGQVLAQGVMACGRTVDGSTSSRDASAGSRDASDGPAGGPRRVLHSVHAYFMRAGDDTQPIHFAVERMRDGGSFSTRRVHAIQHGKPILSMSASFQVPAEGLDHQDEMPAVTGPDALLSLTDVFGRSKHPAARFLAHSRPVEQRYVEGDVYARPAREHVAHQNVWMRAIGRLPDDPLLHEAVLAYGSDYSLLQPVLRRHGETMTTPGLRMASLDHAMWFHRPARADEWLLYSQRSPSAQGGRGLGIGRIFTRDGTLAATVAQEGMIRIPTTA